MLNVAACRLLTFIFFFHKLGSLHDHLCCGVTRRSWVSRGGSIRFHCVKVALNLVHSHQKKREAKIKWDVKRGMREPNEQNPFEIFVTMTDIRYTYLHLIAFELTCSTDTTKNHTKYWVIHMGCVCCKISRPLRRIYLLGRSKRWRVVDWSFCC